MAAQQVHPYKGVSLHLEDSVGLNAEKVVRIDSAMDTAEAVPKIRANRVIAFPAPELRRRFGRQPALL